MARDAITVTTWDRDGLTTINQVLGVVANGLEIASGWDLDLVIEVENTDTSARTVSVQNALGTVDGLTVSDLDVSVPAAVAAAYTTALAGANNDIIFTARHKGKEGNTIRVQYVVSGLNTALSVAVTGRKIVVTVATDGAGAATSTADDVKAAIEALAAADNLVTVADAAANDGTGVVTALAATALSGGIDGKTYIANLTRVATFTQTDGKLYIDIVNDDVLYFRAYTK